MNLSISNVRHRTCPRCKGPLRPLDLRGIEIDTCPTCQGAWFDQCEVEAFLRTKRDLPNYVPFAFRNWSDSSLPCPVCGRMMQTLHASDVFPFDMERCPDDKGYWFDGGEIDQVSAVAEQKTLRLKEQDTSVEDKMQKEIAQHEVARIERKRINRYQPEQAAAVLEDASFFDLSGPQKLMALLGLPVESDRFCEWRSWMNLCLIAINVAVFVMMLLASGSALGLVGLFPKEWFLSYGLVPERLLASPLGASYTVITSMFMHGGIVHLLGNMFFLFTVGDDVEKRLGHWPYLGFYLVAGIVADLVSLFTANTPSIPHIGASGAIAGVMGAYMALCPHKSFYVWMLRIGLFGNMIAVSAWLYLVFWFGAQLLSLKFGNPGIDYGAHIGGFAFGFVAGMIVRRTQTFNGFTGDWEWGRQPRLVD